MKKQHRVHKYLFLLTAYILVISLLLPGCSDKETVTTKPAPETAEPPAPTELEKSAEPIEPEIVVPHTQAIVGNRINSIRASGVTGTTIGVGAFQIAWGDHFVKTVATENTVFTYAMQTYGGSFKAYMYSKKDGEEWREGVSFIAAKPPNLLVDSKDYVHLIAFEPYDLDDEYMGRLFHIKFDQPNTVSGTYTFEYITPDTRETGWALDTCATWYYGASIDKNDVIMVAYTNAFVYEGDPASRTISARIYDPTTGEWTYETVATHLPSQFCYPFVAATDGYFHVLATEDEYDVSLEGTGYPFRYGMIKHFQRAKNSDKWVESTLIDMNETLTSQEIHELWFRHYELLIDQKGTVHVIILYCTDENGNPCACTENPPKAYHYWKAESGTIWQSEPAIDTSCGWLRIWEREDGKLFYVYSKWGEQLCLIPFGTTQRYIISDLVSPYIDQPNPFVAAARGGTNPGSILNLVVFSGTLACEGVAISVDTSVIE